MKINCGDSSVSAQQKPEKILTGELIIAEEQYPVLYKDAGLQKYLDIIKEEVKAESEKLDLNPETKKGREAIGSLARKVSSSKVCIEKPGRDYLKQLKAAVRPAEVEIKRFVDEVDAIRDSILAPRQQWEEKEQARIQAHEESIASIRTFLSEDCSCDTAEILKGKLETLTRHFEPDDSYEEFFEEAQSAYEQAAKKLETALSAREKYEQEQAELEQLRREKAEREAREEAERQALEAKEREERIAREAAERAQREAEEKARAEREAAEQRESELRAAAERAEKNRIDSHERNILLMEEYLNSSARRSSQAFMEIKNLESIYVGKDFEEFQDAADATFENSKRHLLDLHNDLEEKEEQEAKAEAERIQRETEERLRQEAEAKRQAEEAAQRKREENKRHCGAINRAARDALVLNCGLSTDKAKEVVEAIAKGMVDNVQINY